MNDNALSSYWYALERDTPAKRWFYADLRRDAICRALRIDPTDPGAIYAAAPFRLYQHEGRHVIIAAFPCPALFDPDPDWLGIETVIAWDPVENTVQTLGDSNPQLVGAFPDTTEGAVFGTPFAFFRAWVEQRAAFAIAYQAASKAHFTTPPAERDAPGMLIVGDAAKVHWPTTGLPETLHCVGIDAQTVNRAILRQARLPRAVQSNLRAAA